MTREQAKELLPITQAYAEGKQIQDAIEGLTDWVDTDEINLEYEGQKNKTSDKARTKVQTLQKQRRVLAGNAETSAVWMVEIKKSGSFRCIGEVSWSDVFETVYIALSTSESLSRSSDSMFEQYTFYDGTTFGIKEE